jgi:transcription elongation factor Elf1
MNNNIEIDHEYTDDIVCPYCGYEFTDSWEFEGNEDLGLIDCQSCEKPFIATRNVEVTYTTEKAKVGTCRKCGKENVVIEDHTTYSGATLKVHDYCDDCYHTALHKLFKEHKEIIDIREEK